MQNEKGLGCAREPGKGGGCCSRSLLSARLQTQAHRPPTLHPTLASSYVNLCTHADGTPALHRAPGCQHPWSAVGVRRQRTRSRSPSLPAIRCLSLHRSGGACTRRHTCATCSPSATRADANYLPRCCNGPAVGVHLHLHRVAARRKGDRVGKGAGCSHRRTVVPRPGRRRPCTCCT